MISKCTKNKQKYYADEEKLWFKTEKSYRSDDGVTMKSEALGKASAYIIRGTMTHYQANWLQELDVTKLYHISYVFDTLRTEDR